MVLVSVPATTANLGPGFDVLGLALNLYNFVEMRLSSRGLTIEVEGEGKASIPTDDRNIVFQAARKVWNKCGFAYPGLHIKLSNNIPLARGLGSSAAAITGGIVAANALAGYPLSTTELLKLASEFEGHPDNVAPALLGGLVMSIVDGAHIYAHKIEIRPDIRIGAVIPHFPLSTKKGRQLLPKQVPLEDAVYNISRTAFLITAFLQDRLDLLTYGMQDKLHQPYRSSVIPGMEQALQRARAAGAQGVALSGSGPTLVAFCGEHNIDEVCHAMETAFQEQRIEVSIMKLLPDNQGARVINGGY